MKERKQAIWRKYNFPDAALLDRTESVIRHFHRDRADLEACGLDYDTVVKLGNLRLRFMDFPSDDEMAGSWMVVVRKKEEARQALVNALRTVMVAVEKDHGVKSGRYRSFGTRRMADKGDADLLLTGRRSVRLCRRMEGLLPSLKEASTLRLAETAQRFEESLHIVQDKVSERDIRTEERVQLGNELYDLMMEVAEAGKAAYQASSPAKYQEYLNYESNADEKRRRRLGRSDVHEEE